MNINNDCYLLKTIMPNVLLIVLHSTYWLLSVSMIIQRESWIKTTRTKLFCTTHINGVYFSCGFSQTYFSLTNGVRLWSAIVCPQTCSQSSITWFCSRRERIDVTLVCMLRRASHVAFYLEVKRPLAFIIKKTRAASKNAYRCDIR